jgi:hypothetical protein
MEDQWQWEKERDNGLASPIVGRRVWWNSPRRGGRLEGRVRVVFIDRVAGEAPRLRATVVIDRETALPTIGSVFYVDPHVLRPIP